LRKREESMGLLTVKRRRLDPNIDVYEGNLSGSSDDESGVLESCKKRERE
jgi:hypothetical protein